MFIAIQLYRNINVCFYFFFSKLCASKLGVRLIYGCSLYTNVNGTYYCYFIIVFLAVIIVVVIVVVIVCHIFQNILLTIVIVVCYQNTKLSSTLHLNHALFTGALTKIPISDDHRITSLAITV